MIFWDSSNIAVKQERIFPGEKENQQKEIQSQTETLHRRGERKPEFEEEGIDRKAERKAGRSLPILWGNG